MGPVIWQTKGESKYSIRAFPIGGYVLMAGENLEDEVVEETYVEDGEEKTRSIDIPPERTINGLNNFKKFLVIGAGVIFNFIFSFLMLFLLFSISGYPSHFSNNIRVNPNSAAHQAGLKNKDFVIRISGELIDNETEEVVKRFDEKVYGVYELDENGDFIVDENNKKSLKMKKILFILVLL